MTLFVSDNVKCFYLLSVFLGIVCYFAHYKDNNKKIVSSEDVILSTNKYIVLFDRGLLRLNCVLTH